MTALGRARLLAALWAMASCVPFAPVRTPAAPTPASEDASPSPGSPTPGSTPPSPAPTVVDLPRASDGTCPIAFPDADVVLAVVGDTTLTACDVALADARDARQGLAARPPRAVLADLVTEALMATRARELGLDRDPGTARRVRETLATAVVAQAALATSTSSDQSVARYYEQHQEELTLPPRVHLREIVLASEQDAQRVIERLRDEPFEAVLAETTSTDGPRDGGDLGLVPTGGNDRVPSTIAEAGFALETPGAVSPTPIESVAEVRVGRHGTRRVSRWHVVQLLARLPATTLSLADATRTIRHRLRFGAYGAARGVARESLLDRLRREIRPGPIAPGALQRIHIRAPRR